MENKILKAIEALDKKFDTKIDALDKKFDKKIDDLDKKFDKRFNTIESQTKENTQILQALMHSTEVKNAEHEQIMTRMEKMQGDITRIKTDVSILKKDLSTMEVVTANNYADLAKLKAVQ